MKKKLKEIVTQIRGVSYKPTDIKSEIDGIPILRANNIQDDGINLDELVYIDSKKVHEEQYLKKGDIVICASSGSKNLVGKAATYNKNEKASFGVFCKVVRVNESENLCKEFVQQYFQSKLYRNAISELSIGANINNIKTEHIDALKINIPSLEEQKKIASHLDTIQSAIDNKKQQLTALDELVKSKFVEMFGENPVENGKWKVEKLDTLVQVTSSKRIYAEEQTDSGIPFLRISDLVSRINGLEQAELYISYEKYNEFGKKGWVPTKDDILVTTRGTLGLCYIIREDDEFYFQDGMITWLKFDNHEKVLSVFICYLFAYVLSPKFNIKSNGATVKYLSISDLKVEKIPVPPIELQNTFAEYVQKIDSAKSIIKTQLNDLNELLESKMDFYFGE